MGPLAAATSKLSGRLLVCWQRCSPGQLTSGEPALPAASTMLTVLHTAGLLRNLAEAWLGGADAGVYVGGEKESVRVGDTHPS